ncbi:MAG TPA: hypothetical protein VKY22_12575 [Bradyrhizobium sp.]|nr:hypothetical protein [Bradyrhizobium sp.]
MKTAKPITDRRRGRIANAQCSMARAMAVVGDRWSILILREAYYGTTRFDDSNITSGSRRTFSATG